MIGHEVRKEDRNGSFINDSFESLAVACLGRYRTNKVEQKHGPSSKRPLSDREVKLSLRLFEAVSIYTANLLLWDGKPLGNGDLFWISKLLEELEGTGRCIYSPRGRVGA